MKTLSGLHSLSMVRASLFLRPLSCPINLWASLLLSACSKSLQFDLSPTGLFPNTGITTVKQSMKMLSGLYTLSVVRDSLLLRPLFTSSKSVGFLTASCMLLKSSV
jgi:hypothetical protein